MQRRASEVVLTPDMEAEAGGAAAGPEPLDAPAARAAKQPATGCAAEEVRPGEGKSPDEPERKRRKDDLGGDYGEDKAAAADDGKASSVESLEGIAGQEAQQMQGEEYSSVDLYPPNASTDQPLDWPAGGGGT